MNQNLSFKSPSIKTALHIQVKTALIYEYNLKFSFGFFLVVRQKLPNLVN